MIIDASHPEETRVVVVRGNRVEEFDFEFANKRPLRGNIYLAKVTRVEPSLQAAFVDYGGNRHGFLAFSEIHPDYYQIPIADRQALLEEEALSERDEEDEPNGERRSRRHRRPRHPEIQARVSEPEALSETAASESYAPEESERTTEYPNSEELESNSLRGDLLPGSARGAARDPLGNSEWGGEDDGSSRPDQGSIAAIVDRAGPETPEQDLAGFPVSEAVVAPEPLHDRIQGEEHPHDDDDNEVTTLDGGAEERFASNRKDRQDDEGEPVEHIGGDALEEVPRRPQRLRRQYKI